MPEAAPKESYTVEVSKRLAGIIRQPLIFYLVATLTGVSISFAPFFLYQLGVSGASLLDWRVLACFGVVYFVPLYYMLAGRPLIYKIWQTRGSAS